MGGLLLLLQHIGTKSKIMKITQETRFQLSRGQSESLVGMASMAKSFKWYPINQYPLNPFNRPSGFQRIFNLDEFGWLPCNKFWHLEKKTGIEQSTKIFNGYASCAFHSQIWRRVSFTQRQGLEKPHNSSTYVFRDGLQNLHASSSVKGSQACKSNMFFFFFEILSKIRAFGSFQMFLPRVWFIETAVNQKII